MGEDEKVKQASKQLQRELARLLSPFISEQGFVLAGSAAIREHGLIHRPTEDIDLFTIQSRKKEFNLGLNRALQVMADNGYNIETIIGAELQPFARLHVTKDGLSTDVDFAIMPRHYPPEKLDVGYVSALPDAVGSKIFAASTRSSRRDFLDAVEIYRNSPYNTEELLRLARDYSFKFEPADLAKKLETMVERDNSVFSTYLPTEEIDAIKQDARTWIPIIKKLEHVLDKPLDRQAFLKRLRDKALTKASEQQPLMQKSRDTPEDER